MDEKQKEYWRQYYQANKAKIRARRKEIRAMKAQGQPTSPTGGRKAYDPAEHGGVPYEEYRKELHRQYQAAYRARQKAKAEETDYEARYYAEELGKYGPEPEDPPETRSPEEMMELRQKIVAMLMDWADKEGLDDEGF